MKLTVRSLRELALKYLGQGHSRLTKAELVARLRTLPTKVRELIAVEVSHRGDAVKGTARKVARKARNLGPVVSRRAPVLRSAHAVSKGKKAAKGTKSAAARGAGKDEAPASPLIPSLSESQALTSSRRAAAIKQAAPPTPSAASHPASKSGPAAKAEPTTVASAAAPRATPAARAPATDSAKASERRAASPAESRASAPPAKARVSARPKRRPRATRKPQSVVEGFFVTPPSAEARKRLASVRALGSYPEQLGDLPSAYDTEGTTALARDPHTLFVFWSFQASTLRRAAAGLRKPRAVLRVFEGDTVLREESFELSGRSFYLHQLPAGRMLRVEAYLVGEDGEAVRLGPASNPVQLPPDGPSTETSLRFLKVPQGLPLERLREYVRDGRARLSERDAEVDYFSWERFDLPGSAEGLQEKRVRRRGGPPEREEGQPEGEGAGWARNQSGVGRWPRPKSGRQG